MSASHPFLFSAYWKLGVVSEKRKHSEICRIRYTFLKMLGSTKFLLAFDNAAFRLDPARKKVA